MQPLPSAAYEAPREDTPGLHVFLWLDSYFDNLISCYYHSVKQLYGRLAKNPNRPESDKLPHPAELTATLLERNRELRAILENLHAMLSNGNGEAREVSDGPTQGTKVMEK